MRSEPTQRGNPNKLTIKQHVFPVASIARFAQGDGCVNVRLLANGKAERLRPGNALFYARRVWNQASEQGFMKKVEGAFQPLADRIVRSSLSVGPSDNRVISQFYWLCRLRAEARQSPSRDVQMKGVLPGRELTKNKEERLEKNGYIFSRGTTIPGRHMASIRMQVRIGRLCTPELTWAVVHSTAIEFIVPDTFGEIGIIPLSPNYCLVANVEGGEISSDNAVAMNRLAIAKASKYYFARDLTKCGV